MCDALLSTTALFVIQRSQLNTTYSYNIKKQTSLSFFLLHMERKEPMDFSSYFYFEASGDSEEADYDDYPPIMAKYACEIAKADTSCEDDHHDDDDYDALSCNGSGACDVAELDEDESCNEQQQQHHDDEDKSGVSGMSCCEDGDEIQEEQMKSYVSFDSSQEIVDEMEKNRLFWEACLAS